MQRHFIQRLWAAEDLVRLRRPGEHRRHIASQRSARIDPNPHQIDAVMFALSRIPDGGCILADEVGLGKTIEAGLVIAQLLAEGASRILVVTPKSLLGQWKQELYTLFGIDAHEVARDAGAFAGAGVFLATRDFVGGETGARLLHAAERFELCVVDEAHEVFAGIYRRFDRTSPANDAAPRARMAQRLFEAIRGSGTPALLLTATPIQNSLLELWGLVRYVDPTGTLLGDLGTFRQIFCPKDDRVLADGQHHELQRRLATVLQRTLRHEAQEFMREPFVGRQCRTFDYVMSPEERALYDDVTRYLLEPSLHAFDGGQRALLLLCFHRRMASSSAALASSLDHVAARLRRRLERRPLDRVSTDCMLDDLEDDGERVTGDVQSAPADDALEGIVAELARVEVFSARARALPTDSKGSALIKALELLQEQAEHRRTSGKVVIFTEALTTQDYVRDLLLRSGLVNDGDITLFRGDNDTPRAARALERWWQEVGNQLPMNTRPSPGVAVRLALVHEFQNRSRILISTEAGAKGLNLQFCDTVINYDLPWNPQRIEQRIGRCHRYGQSRDVTVINFLASDNEAQRLTYEILSEKLDLFGTVLGTSDEVLHRPGALASESLVSAVGNEFETQIRRIYEHARTIDDIERELRELRSAIESRRRAFDATQTRTEDVIRRRLDLTVQQTFRRIQDELPRELEEFDRHVERVVVDYLDAIGAAYRLESRGHATKLSVEASAALPAALRGGTASAIGDAIADPPLFPLHLGHPLVVAALEEVRGSKRAAAFAIRITSQSETTRHLRGARGRLQLIRVRHRGLDATERLIPVIVMAGAAGPLDVALARQLLAEPMTDLSRSAVSGVSDEALADAVDELLFVEVGDAGSNDRRRFERTMEQIERFVTDRILLLERQRAAALERRARAEGARDRALGAEQRTRTESALLEAQNDVAHLEELIAQLRAGDDEAYQRWRAHTEARRYARPEIERLLDAELEIT